MCTKLHPCYQEAKLLSVEKISSRWVFVWDLKLPTGLLLDEEAKTKQATELELIERTGCV